MITPHSSDVTWIALSPLRSTTFPFTLTVWPAFPATFSLTETGFSLRSR